MIPYFTTRYISFFKVREKEKEKQVRKDNGDLYQSFPVLSIEMVLLKLYKGILEKMQCKKQVHILSLVHSNIYLINATVQIKLQLFH